LSIVQYMLHGIGYTSNWSLCGQGFWIWTVDYKHLLGLTSSFFIVNGYYAMPVQVAIGLLANLREQCVHAW